MGCFLCFYWTTNAIHSLLSAGMALRQLEFAFKCLCLKRALKIQQQSQASLFPGTGMKVDRGFRVCLFSLQEIFLD